MRVFRLTEIRAIFIICPYIFETMNTIHPRSMLFVSGERPDRFAKALAVGADLVCIDLEDAVHPERKAAARQAVFDFLAQADVSLPVAVRINGLRTADGLEDVLAWRCSGARARCVLLPKTECATELALLQGWLGEHVQSLVALIETPEGMQAAAAIARARLQHAPALGALMLGGADLCAELGARFDWDGLRHARGQLIQAARLTGLQAWDVPHVDLQDLDGLREETTRVRALGFDCKTAIHPAQIAVIHAALADDPAEVQQALALLAALRAQSGEGRGAFVFEGKMVDAPLIRRAERIAARHSAAPLP